MARSKAKKDAAKAKSKVGKKGGAKSKKSPKGATASSTSDVEGEEIEPPSVLEVYESVKREIEEYRAFRKEEIARHHAEKRLAPRDPEGEPVLEEVHVSFITTVPARGSRNCSRLLFGLYYLRELYFLLRVGCGIADGNHQSQCSFPHRRAYSC